jgi:hypothetical protein
VWPAVDTFDNPDDTSSNPKRVAGNNPGTWVSKQSGGPSLCGPTSGSPLLAGGCPDRTPPVSHFASKGAVTVKNQKLTVRGGSSDKGCQSANLIPGSGRVASVVVSVARVGGKCGSPGGQGEESGSGGCAYNVKRRAKGTGSWTATFDFPASLPKGRYRVRAQALDAAGNREQPPISRQLTIG